MWEAFGGAIKVFAEKYLIASIISLIIGTVSYILTPDDFWVLTKLNKIWYFLLISGCMFIFIHGTIVIFHKIQGLRYSLYHKNRISSTNKEALEKLWTLVDGFDQEDRKLLLKFISNGNSPYLVNGNVHYSSEKLLGSQYVHKIQGYKSDNSKLQIVEKFDPIKMMVSSESYVQYVLIEPFYKSIKMSHEKYGQICHFKEV
ncbi:MAG: hypothetical protein Q8S24_12680 [Eubacteriales bacterium]|nr:hypothetical protein [Eubacteriales bacterium]